MQRNTHNQGKISPTLSSMWKKLRGTANPRKSTLDSAPPTKFVKPVETSPISEHESTNNDNKKGNNDYTDNKNNKSSSLEVKMSKTAHHKFSDILPMNNITKSPYEPNQSAEVGEHIFENFKMLVSSTEELQGEVHDLDGVPTLTLQTETIDLFGEVLATSFVKANHVIGKSGILFSPVWVEDKQCKIRGVQCGWISKPMLLLLLQEQRFARADDANLASVVSLLGVVSIFFDALKEWKLEFPRLESSPTLQFTAKKRECLKCLIFVARVYRCIKVLRLCEQDQNTWLREHHPGLYRKVQQCLDIMNQHVKVHPKRLEAIAMAQQEKRQQQESRKRSIQEVVRAENDRRQLESKSRRKVTTIAPPPLQCMDGLSSSSESSGPSPTMELPELALASHRALRNSVEEPVDMLQQNKEALQCNQTKPIGEMLVTLKKEYRRMGRTIKRLERKIQEERELLREEVRQELLQEGWQRPNAARRMNGSLHRGEMQR